MIADPSQQMAAIILAAGKGTRMKSSLPKVLHEIGGKALLQWVIDSLKQTGVAQTCVVLGGDLESFKVFLDANPNLSACQQLAREGTADAIASCVDFVNPKSVPAYARGQMLRGPRLSDDVRYLLLCMGDTPAINPQTLARFCEESLRQRSDLSVLAMKHPTPKGYGRILVDEDGRPTRIVEEKNASDEERNIDRVNTGIFFAEKDTLFSCLAEVQRNEVSGEFYLTDCLEIARRRGLKTACVVADDYREFDGINDQEQFAEMSQRLLKTKS